MCSIGEGSLVGAASGSSRHSGIAIGREVAGNVRVRSSRDLPAPLMGPTSFPAITRRPFVWFIITSLDVGVV